LSAGRAEVVEVALAEVVAEAVPAVVAELAWVGADSTEEFNAVATAAG
jgi:hypothetical protein